MRVKENNKGYSLVELMITLAIFGIVMIGIALIMRTTSVSYVNGSNEVAMQTEAQIIANQIEELLVDANGGSGFAEGVKDGYDEYLIYDGYNNVRHHIVYNDDTNEILYDKVNDITGSSSNLANYSLMAEYVSDFDIIGWNTEENNVNRDNKVTVEIEMDKDGYVYEVSREIYFRNAIENPTVYNLSSTANSGDDADGAKPYSQVVDIDRYEVIDLKKECGFLAVAETTENFTDLYTYADTLTNSGTYEIAKAITSCSHTNNTKMYITTNATANATTGFDLYADANTGIMIKGITAYNADGSVAAYKTVLLTTSPVSFDLDTSTKAADGAVYLSTATGDGGGGYMWVGVKGINIASMVYTNEKPYQYALVAYDCGGTVGYTKDVGNLPQVKKVSTVTHGYSDGVSLVLNDCGIQKGLAFKPDPEENGFLIVQNNDALSATTDALTAMSDGDYRLAIMIHFPGQSLTASHTVVDLALVPHGTTMTNYKGASEYEATPSAWGITFTN